jgi:D-glycero-D-manno-heptose 1,7-bisphosphate phosphatase
MLLLHRRRTILVTLIMSFIKQSLGFSVRPSKLFKLVLLDRDGVVNVDVGSPGVLSTHQLLLTKNAGVAIGKLKRAGKRVVLVTNQSCVGKGLISQQDLEQIHHQLQFMIHEQDADATLDQIYFCPGINVNDDARMKPKPGMLLEACRDAGLLPTDCVMVGDSVRDLQAATAAGVPLRILVSTGESVMRMDSEQ